MQFDSSIRLSRRRLLCAGAAAGLALPGAGAARRPHAAPVSAHRLSVTRGSLPLIGEAGPKTEVWAYDGMVPGPILRVRQGEPLSIVVENRLAEGTTVHWHGIRLPIDMDGVPGISQPPIEPGERFTYAFTPPDAGTFWYHPHVNSLEQLGRGLAGALIVEEREPFAVDRELVWMLSDWRLSARAQIEPGFGNAMEAAMAGRVGNTVTVNGSLAGAEPVRAGERVRLRLINAAPARIMALGFEGHRPVIVARDGQPCEPHEPEGNRLLLGPAMRLDVVLDMQGEPGRRYPVVDDFYDGLDYRLVDLTYDKAAPVRRHPSDAPRAPPRNPLPEPDLAAAARHVLTLQGGMMGGASIRGDAAWAINGSSMTGDGHAGMPPLLTLQRGRSYRFTLHNETAWWHPMHLHGHSFRILRRNAAAVPHRQWADTVLVAPRETIDIAFVADNPGDWMLHCHVADHQMAGMTTILRIT